MSVFHFVLAIIFICTLGSMWQQYMKHKSDIADINKKLQDDETPALKARIEELEERIRVLERIATEPGERINRELADL